MFVAHSGVWFLILCCTFGLQWLQQCIVLAASRRMGPGNTEQDWGYITVRPGAHMFWWMYYTTATTPDDVSNYTDRPLIMWLQGGPGMPSSGYGNFGELGPLNITLDHREDSTIKYFNILYVDSPVGVGYSYFSENFTKIASSGPEISEDLTSFLRKWMNQHSEFKEVPLYILGESYGGKMATEFVYHLVKTPDVGSEIGNLSGMGLGDSYISPMDYVRHYGPFAHHLGLIDKRAFERIDELARQIQVLIGKKEYETAVDMSNQIIDKLLFCDMVGIDMYNIMKRRNESALPSLFDHHEELTLIMNDEVKQKLGIAENITWKFYSDRIHLALKPNLMGSVTDKIEYLLNNSNVKIIVYNGLLDFLVNTAGTIEWMSNLDWYGKEDWANTTQSFLEIDNVIEGYSKKFDNLVFYVVFRAGHSVPIDNLPVMNEMLRRELLN